jgi:catechol-2,3-dioxygenase
MVFRTTGEKFVDFLKHLDDLELFFIRDKVTKDNVVDHDISFSIYFDDPDGNKLELTSYDYDFVKSNI